MVQYHQKVGKTAVYVAYLCTTNRHRSTKAVVLLKYQDPDLIDTHSIIMAPSPQKNRPLERVVWNPVG